MNSRQRRASSATTAAARSRLLDAATGLLQTGGPDAATSRAIADAARENLGAITYYFGSKVQLVGEAMVSNARSLMEPVTRELTRDDVDHVTKMLIAVRMLNEILSDNRDQLPGYLHSLAATHTNDVVRDAIRALHRSLAATLATAMAEQQQQDLLPNWVDPVAMAQLIVALVNGVAIATAIDPDETDASAIAAQFATLLLNARGPSS
jgi:AcrR family transcriptional regulator